MQMQNGGNIQDFVLSIQSEGYTRVSSYKKGVATQYVLMNPETQGVRYVKKNRDFNAFCKAIIGIHPDGGVLAALQKAGLASDS
jgi:hypothetical protein